MTYSESLARIARTDPRVREYEYDEGNEMGKHWLHLADGWIAEDGSHTIHESTVRECIYHLTLVREEELGEGIPLSELSHFLCCKDKRHPLWEGLYSLDDETQPEPRVNCACDNCFYGRDRLAMEIFRLRSKLEEKDTDK